MVFLDLLFPVGRGTLEGMNKENEPATNKELDQAVEQLAQAMKTSSDRIEKRITNLESSIATMKDEIVREFHVVAENIHRDVAAANQDEISAMKNTDQSLGQRVTSLEQRAGIAPPQ
jgi:translation initiation factor 2 beta subunit (eIF-2beta)/eIF-5